jgi:hypothetical protein
VWYKRAREMTWPRELVERSAVAAVHLFEPCIGDVN